MKSPKAVKLAVARLLCIASLATISAGGCGSDRVGPLSMGCTLIGCLSGAHIALPAAVAREVLQGSSLSVCRNETCSEAVFQAAEAAPGDGHLSAGASAFSADLIAFASPTSTGYLLDIHYLVSPSLVLSDGDVYSVRVTSSAGAVLAEGQQAVKAYSEYYPNGRECDSAACRSATITF